MIVVTSIVGSAAYSAYQTHAVRQEVSAAATAALELAAPAVISAFRRDGQVPEAHRVRIPGRREAQLVADITIVNGRIDVLFGGGAAEVIAGRTLPLTPYETVESEVVWLCGNRQPGPGLEPLGFAGGGRIPTQTATTLEERYLPRDCR